MSNFFDNFSGYADLKIHGVRLPEFKIDPIFYERLKLDPKIDNFSFLKALCNQGFASRKITSFPNKQEYVERGKRELTILHELGFTDYILLIWDIVNFAKSNKIEVGAGRGSAAGSLVLYLIGVTNVDPIKNGLFFERFVSKARAKSTVVDGITYLDGSLLPDVDVDMCFYRRAEVLNYIKQKFPNRTSKILTVTTMSGKLVIKETVKATLNYSEEQVKVLANSIEKHFGQVTKLQEALQSSEDLANWEKQPINNQNVNCVCQRLSNKEVFSIACCLEGLPKNFGVHPSAMAISFGNLSDICPVQTAMDSEGVPNLVSGFDMYTMTDLVVKVDVLGLRTASIINQVSKDVGIDIQTVDLYNPAIYEIFNEFSTPHGIFQIEAHTQYQACRKICPSSLAEVSDLMALARPGALAYIDDYVKSKTGEKEHESLNPILDEILKDTKFVPLYQEQMMAIGHKVFGFTLEESEILRRIVGKKDVAKMPAWKEKVFAAAEKQGLSKETAEFYWKVLDDSKNYSFNKCLSPTTVVDTAHGFKTLAEVSVGDFVRGFNTQSGSFEFNEVVGKHESCAELYEVEFENGMVVKCSMEHKFLCEDMQMRPLKDIVAKRCSVFFRKSYSEAVMVAATSTVKQFHKIGKQPSLDLEIDSPDHNFVADGLVVSNSHSIAYATLAVQTLYLKWNYPRQFFLALLKMSLMEPNPHEEIAKIVGELPYFGIKLLPPDLLKSEIDFSIEGKDIRFGFSAIKGVSDKALKNIQMIRQPFSNKFEMFEIATQAGINIGVLSSMILAGVMDSVLNKRSRSYLALEAQTFNQLTDREKTNIIRLSKTQGDDLFALIKSCVANGTLDESGKLPIFKPTRWILMEKGQNAFENGGTIQKKCAKYQEIYVRNSQHEQLANWYFEKELLGFSYSCNLFDILSKEQKVLKSIQYFRDEAKKDEKLYLCGTVKELSRSIAKKSGKDMLRFVLDDSGVSVRCLFCNNHFAIWLKKNEVLPQDDDLVIVKGSKGDDAFFLNDISILNRKIYLKMRDLE